jgi:hypothetical protein
MEELFDKYSDSGKKNIINKDISHSLLINLKESDYFVNLFWISKNEKQYITSIDVRSNKRDWGYIFHLRYDIWNTWFDYDLWTDEQFQNITYSSISKDNADFSMEQIIKRQLYNMPMLWIKNIYSEADRSGQWTIRDMFWYNIWPKYWYDVSDDKKEEMLMKLKNLLNDKLSSNEQEDKEIKKQFSSFFEEYMTSKDKLLMPKLFENTILRKIWREYGWSFPCVITFENNHPTWEYFKKKYINENGDLL